MKLIGITSDQLSKMRLGLTPFLEMIASPSKGKLSVSGILESTEKQDLQIWAAMEGEDIRAVALSEVFIADDGALWARVIGGAGHERERWQHLIEQMIEDARNAGFSGFEVLARSGWTRIYQGKYGLKETHRLLEVKF